MPTVVILHAAEDTLPARALAEKVRQAKLEVVSEKSGEAVREAVKSAQVTIALWSPRSVTQAELAENASFAKGKSKLIHATMQGAQPPAPFNSEQAVNLTGWRGEDDYPPWRELAQLVTSKAGVAPLPPPAPKPASGFFQPGPVAPQAQQATPPAQAQQRNQQRPAQPQQRPAQQPQQRAAQQPQQQTRAAPARAPAEAGEKKGGANMVLIAIIAFVVVAVVGGGGYWFMTQNSNDAAYASIDNTSVSALREFIASDPSAADRERAEADLERLEASALNDARAANSIEAWETFLRDFPNSEEAVFARGQIEQLRVQQNSGPSTLGPDGQPLSPNAAPITELETLPAPTPAPSGTDGPASLTPPAEEPVAEEPGDAPSN